MLDIMMQVLICVIIFLRDHAHHDLGIMTDLIMTSCIMTWSMMLLIIILRQRFAVGFWNSSRCLIPF